MARGGVHPLAGNSDNYNWVGLRRGGPLVAHEKLVRGLEFVVKETGGDLLHQLNGGTMALIGAFVEGPMNGVGCKGRDHRVVAAKWGGIVVDLCVGDFPTIEVAKEGRAGKKIIENGSEGINVSRGSEVRPNDPLGGHVFRGSENGIGRGGGGQFHGEGNTVIDDFHIFKAGGNNDVGGLEVKVEDAGLVEGIDPTGGLIKDTEKPDNCCDLSTVVEEPVQLLTL